MIYCLHCNQALGDDHERPTSQPGAQIHVRNHASAALSTVELTLRNAVTHLDAVLNGCRTHAEQQAADKAAGIFSRACCNLGHRVMQAPAQPAWTLASGN